ncbi:MAG: cation diffusion facilitator family transporter [Ignavibacteria bacterium]|nr:cation diffusion facilitator family transporter [Ignavibacteria bacterium]
MDKNDRIFQAKRVTILGFIVNVILTTGKLFAGIVGKSSAMLADGIHSFSDMITDLIVILFVGVSGKERDNDHQYGHGKYETFATMLISFALAIVGVGIFWEGLQKVIDTVNGIQLPEPGMIAFYAALVSILGKEIIYQYTIIVGKKIDSQAVIANAWHHRSDAFSSIGTALGIGGAIFFGESWRILDPIAGMIVSIFILKIAIELGLPSIKELLEVALPETVRKEISQIIASQKGVEHFHQLRTRKIGNIMAVEVHVKVNKNLSVEESHTIATEVENALRDTYGANTHVGVHIEPYYKKTSNIS